MPNMYLSLIFGYRDKKFIQKLKSVFQRVVIYNPENSFMIVLKKRYSPVKYY